MAVFRQRLVYLPVVAEDAVAMHADVGHRSASRRR
jgi:hypothetical protein